jgi:hypothetical protein
MGGVTFDTITSVSLQQGDNLFEQGVITLAAGVTVKAGTILKRVENGKFEIATDTPPNPGTPAEGGGWATPPSPGDIPVAVMPFDLKNEKSAQADMGFRALTGGKVRRDLLNLNGSPITDGQADALRNYGIIAVKITDLSFTP